MEIPTPDRKEEKNINEEDQEVFNQKQDRTSPSYLQRCKQHPGEDVSYFCMTCEAGTVCPECVLHGIHKNHEVQTIRSAYPIMKEKMDQELNGINNQLKELNINVIELKSSQEQLKSYKETTTTEIVASFDELHKFLSQKRDLAIGIIETSIQNELSKVEQLQESVLSKMSELKSSQEYLEEQLNQLNIVDLLEFYSEKYKLFKEKIACIGEIPFIKSSDFMDSKKICEGNMRNFAKNIKNLQENISDLTFNEDVKRVEIAKQAQISNQNQQFEFQNIIRPFTFEHVEKPPFVFVNINIFRLHLRLIQY